MRFFDVSEEGAGALREKSLRMKGRALARLGETQAARSTLRAAAEEFPENDRIRQDLEQLTPAPGDA